MSENVWEIRLMSLNVGDFLRLSENVWKCLKMYENVGKVLKMSEKFWKCMKLSDFTQKPLNKLIAVESNRHIQTAIL